MSYDASKDKYIRIAPTQDNIGRTSAAVTPSDTVDFASYPKAVIVTAAGDFVVLPLANDDDATITFTAAPVGFYPPFRVRRVLATGTTASVATIDD